MFHSALPPAPPPPPKRKYTTMKTNVQYRLYICCIFMEEIHVFSLTSYQVFRWHVLTAFSRVISRQIFTVFSLFFFMAYRDFPVKTLVKVTKHFTKIFQTFPRHFLPVVHVKRRQHTASIG